MSYSAWKKVHSKNLSCLGHRVLALMLALSMNLPTAVLAADGQVRPTPIVEGEAPTITIEANAVVDRWYDPESAVMNVEDYLTGDLEVAIRVKSGKTDEGWQSFNTLGVALKYSSILTPYKFTLINGIDLSGKEMSEVDKKRAAEEVDLTGTNGFKTMTNMQTLKCKNITAAVGHVSQNGTDGGYLFMEAQADRPVVLEEDTVLAVVTFRYELKDYKIVATEAEKWMTPTVATTIDDGNPSGTGTGKDICLLQFVDRSEINGRYSKYELEYRSAVNDMFYSGTPDAGEVMSCLELEDPTTSKYQGSPTAGKVNFRLVNQTTYNDGGLTLDDLVTVLFYDWDDTLIGVLIVPRDGDARKLVNDYVRDHMIHPDLRIKRPNDDPSWASNVSSLARADSYRGKYPTTAMSEEDALTDTTKDPEGVKYPLTNKLDYVFLKRPMEKVEGTVDASGNPTNTWRQLGTEEEAQWDEDYPYIHGWALIPDEDLTDIQYTHPENVWTTIGVGELSNYTGLANGAYIDETYITDTPVNLISEAEDFAIADFNFGKRVITEDGIQKINSLEPGSVYAVKALYEPGKELLNGSIIYQLISEPYYNKMNSPSAANGAAYSVDVVYGRTNAENGKVRGVARIREPDVRQDTTADIRWEDEYLNNADVDEEKGKGKATYTRVTVDNGEEIGIQLVLSARQNKVDYYLKEAYGSSFVGGGSRTDANSNYTGTAHVIDNYNYKTDTSDVTIDGVSADYYDAPYEDREGSYGFVLYGTLNNMAQKLTEDYNGNLSTADFNNYISMANMNDINLRSHANEKPSGRTLSSFQNALRAAVAEAIRLHGNHAPGVPGDDDRAWDVEHGYAQFTYHQLQLFVAEYLDPNVVTPVLRTAEEADAININWCHLHEECAAAASGKPRNWEQLVAVAQRTDLDREGKIDVIRLLTMAELEEIAHLRADASGVAFANNRAFAIDFIDAVEAGNTTWDTIQDYIVRDEADAAYARETYWWYDGSTSVPLASVSDTVAAVQDAIFPKLAPGETTAVPRNAKINQLKPVYEADYASGAVTTAWNNATKNLSITKGTDEGQKFDTWESFRTKFAAAVRGAENAGVKLVYADDDDADARAKKLRDYWNKLQYSILHNDTYVANPDSAQQAEMNGYWWYDGAVLVNNLATLIRAAQDANSGKPASMNMFQYDALYDAENTELHFARNFQGDKYTGDPDTDTENNAHLVFDEFKQDMMAYVQEDRTFLRNNTPDWNRVQYYLIHGGIEEAYVGQESPYYWWQGGASAQPVDFTLGGSDNDEDPVARADALAVALLDAAFRATYNGNTVAWDDLTTAVLERGRLVKASSGSEANFPDEFSMYATGDLDAFKTEIVALMQVIGGTNVAFPAPTAAWIQIQHYLIKNREYRTVVWLENNTKYWWKSVDSQGTPPNQLFSMMTGYIKAVADAKASGGDGLAEANALRAWLTEENAEKMEFSDGALPVPQGDLDTIPWENFDYAASCGDPFSITWAQIQWLMVAYYNEYFDWMLDDDATAVDYLENSYSLPSTPSWQTSRMRIRVLAREPAGPDYSKMILSLRKRIGELEKRLQNDPSMLEQYAEELQQLLETIQELQSLLDSVSQPPEVVESPQVTESPEVTGSPEPAETPEITETPGETESPEPTGSLGPDDPIGPNPTETPETTESPAPSETVVPTASPTPAESVEPTVSPEPTTSPEPTVSPEPAPTPSGTLETMPEFVDPNTLETETIENKGSDKPDESEEDLETVVTEARSSLQTTPLYAGMARWMRTGLLYSGPAQGHRSLPRHTL